MIDRSGRGGMGPTNAGGRPMNRAYPAKPKPKSAVSALAGAMADAATTPARVAVSGAKGVIGTFKNAAKLVSGKNPYKK